MMGRSVGQDDKALKEAAQWFARLNARSVSTASLHEFRAWRRQPENDAAYGMVETVWRGADSLQSDPDIQGAIAEAMERIGRSVKGTRREASYGRWVGAAVVVLLAVVLFGAGRILRLSRSYETAVGEDRLVLLEDGSRVRLDTDTRLAVRFTPTARQIELLKGQAFFDVAHNPARPFTVQAGSTRVRAVGTRFDVRRDGDQVRVSLMQGAVKVASPATSGQSRVWTLAPGDRLTASPSAQSLHKADVDDDTGWMTGRLIFHDIPLASAIEEVNRYNRGKIILNASRLDDVRVNGTFASGDATDFISAVTGLYDLRSSRQPDGSVVLSPAGSSSVNAS
jgi:transmembrane sensor